MFGWVIIGLRRHDQSPDPDPHWKIHRQAVSRDG
jgi:hypothetical protein